MPILEAMSCGLPVISSKIGAGELITDGFNGIHLDNPNDIQEITDKIKMLIDDKDKRGFLGENARDKALQCTWMKQYGRQLKFMKK